MPALTVGKPIVHIPAEQVHQTRRSLVLADNVARMGDTTVRIELDGRSYSRLVGDATPRSDGGCGKPAGTVAQRLANALSLPSVPEITDEVRVEMRAKIAQAEEDARRIYGDKPRDATA